MPRPPTRRGSIRMRPGSLACLLSVMGRAARVMHLFPEPVGACGHVDVLDTERRERVANGIDDRCAGCYGAGLADALHAQRVVEGRGHSPVELERRELVGGRDEIVGESAGPHLSGLVVVDDLFVERLRDALGDAALDLPITHHPFYDL